MVHLAVFASLLCLRRAQALDVQSVRCWLIKYTLCACGIFSAISVLLTTENFDPGSAWVKVIKSYTREFLMCHIVY